MRPKPTPPPDTNVSYEKAANLFICYTPFHCAIAEILGSTETGPQNQALLITRTRDRRVFTYLDSLMKQRFDVTWIQSSNHIIQIFRVVKWALMEKRNRKKYSLFLGNPKMFLSRLIAFLLNQNEYSSFDDGIGNLCLSGYFADSKENSISAAFFRAVNHEYTYKNFLAHLKTHYTIYSEPNVFSPTKRIACTPFGRRQVTCTKHPKRILISSPLAEASELSLATEIDFYRKMIVQNDIEMVLRHPSETDFKIAQYGIPELRTHLLAEDAIAAIAAIQNPVTIFGCFSSALFNLRNTPGIIAVNCVPSRFNNETWTSVIDLFRNASIQLVFID